MFGAAHENRPNEGYERSENRSYLGYIAHFEKFNDFIVGWSFRGGRVFWRKRKHSFLLRYNLDSLATVKRLIAKCIDEYNTIMPHSEQIRRDGGGNSRILCEATEPDR